MSVILKSCRVPWMISPSGSGVTLTHAESDETPECSVVFGAGRLGEDGRTDVRRIELRFEQCYFDRLGPHDDTEGVESVGYRIADKYAGPMDVYLDWLRENWRATGTCPNPSFYVAERSDWLESLQPVFRTDFRHYVVDGRDGYVELIAKRFKWREWLADGQIVGEGDGID